MYQGKYRTMAFKNNASRTHKGYDQFLMHACTHTHLIKEKKTKSIHNIQMRWTFWYISIFRHHSAINHCNHFSVDQAIGAQFVSSVCVCACDEMFAKNCTGVLQKKNQKWNRMSNDHWSPITDHDPYFVGWINK